MQYKKKSDKMDDQELPDLTENQMAYVEARMSGKGPVDSYRLAYPNFQGKDSSLWVQACKMEKHPKISLWVDQVRREQFRKVLCTRDQWVKEHYDMMMEARSDGNHVATRQYHRDIAEALGIFEPDGKESDVDRLIQAFREHGYGRQTEQAPPPAEESVTKESIH